jgi:hypothetical protein
LIVQTCIKWESRAKGRRDEVQKARYVPTSVKFSVFERRVMSACGSVETQLYEFLTSVLDWGSCSSCCTPSCPLDRRLGRRAHVDAMKTRKIDVFARNRVEPLSLAHSRAVYRMN